MAALAEAVDDLKIANEPRADVANHVRFLRMHLRMLPQPYLSLDTSRMTALYFCVVGLDILGEQWSAAYTTSTVLLSIQSLLAQPNNSDPLNPDAAQMWPNQSLFRETVRSLAQQPP